MFSARSGRPWTLLILLLAASQARGSSELVAGISAPGSPHYPNAGFGPAERSYFPREEDVHAVLLDPGRPYIYAGTFHGQFVRIDRSSMTRIDNLTIDFEEGGNEESILCGFVDPAGDYAYVATRQGDTQRIIKIDLDQFVIADVLELPPAESGVMVALMDPAGAYGYFGTLTTAIVKVDLSTFSRVGSIFLGPAQAVTSGAMDPAGNYAYFGTGSAPGQIHRVNLSTFTRDIAPKNATESQLASCAIDPAGQFAYFGTQTAPGRVVRVDLPNLSDVDLLTLNFDETLLRSAAMHPSGDYAYFGSGEKVVRVNLSSFTRQDAASIGGDNGIISAAVDAAASAAYLGLRATPGSVVRFDLDSFAPGPSAPLLAQEAATAGAMNSAGSKAYYISDFDGVPVKVVEFDLGSFARSQALILDPSELHAATILIDPNDAFAYVGSDFPSPERVTKVALAPLSRVGAAAFLPGEDSLEAGAIAPDGSAAYFANFDASSTIIKLDLSSFMRAGSQPVGSGSSRTRILMMNGDGSALFSEDDEVALRFDLPAFQPAGHAAFDPEDGLAAFGAYDAVFQKLYYVTQSTNELKLVRFGTDPLAREDSLDLSGLGVEALMFALDPEGHWGYIWIEPASPSLPDPGLVRIDLGEFAIEGSWMPFEEPSPLHAPLIDPSGALGYFGRGIQNPHIIRTTLSQKGFIKATRVHVAEPSVADSVEFYSHAPFGNIRAAIYDAASDPALIWQSGPIGNGIDEDFVTIPIAGGAPSSLELEPGDYWLAWQVDTTAAVPSFNAGPPQSGFNLAASFAAFPAALPEENLTFTAENWTAYISAHPLAAGEIWRLLP